MEIIWKYKQYGNYFEAKYVFRESLLATDHNENKPEKQ